MSTTNICPECGHNWNAHGFIGCITVLDNGHSCECKITRSELGLMLERDKKSIDYINAVQSLSAANALARRFYNERFNLRVERDEARAWARCYYAQNKRARLETHLDTMSIGRLRKERDEARKLAAQIWYTEGAHYKCGDMVTDGFGCFWFKWCRECGGTIVFFGPGDFRCAECGK